MLEPLKGAQPTQPLLRTCVSVSFDAGEVLDGRYASGEHGCLAEISLRVTDSVEGYRIGSTAMPYRELKKDDPRMRRRYREASSTGVVIRISEPWFAGGGDSSAKTRDRIAEALKVVLAMEHNIAPAELRSAHQNINLCSFAGAKPIDDAIVIFDNVSGGLRLSAPLFSSFPALLDRLERAASLAGDEALLALPTVERLRAWYAGLTARVKYKTAGFHTWTEDDIAKFRERHALGTKARLALEILLWTGQRRGDAHRFGPPHVRDGRINYEQEKGGKELWLPMAPQLRAAIDAMPAIGVQTFLVTEHGKPFTKGGFGNWFRDRCDEAGLKHCSAHGLRKAIARRLAENGATQKMIKSVGGWSNDREVAIYTAAADQAELARTALTALAEWEARTLR